NRRFRVSLSRHVENCRKVSWRVAFVDRVKNGLPFSHAFSIKRSDMAILVEPVFNRRDSFSRQKGSLEQNVSMIRQDTNARMPAVQVVFEHADALSFNHAIVLSLNHQYRHVRRYLVYQRRS